jgi:hypothetical protein
VAAWILFSVLSSANFATHFSTVGLLLSSLAAGYGLNETAGEQLGTTVLLWPGTVEENGSTLAGHPFQAYHSILDLDYSVIFAYRCQNHLHTLKQRLSVI